MTIRRSILAAALGAAFTLAAHAQAMKAADVHPEGYPTVAAVEHMGQKLEAASRSVLGVTLEQLDEGLHASLAERLGKYDREFAPDLAAYGDVAAARALAAQKARDPDAFAALALSEINAEHLELAEHAALAAQPHGERRFHHREL